MPNSWKWMWLKPVWLWRCTFMDGSWGFESNSNPENTHTLWISAEIFPTYHKAVWACEEIRWGMVLENFGYLWWKLSQWLHERKKSLARRLRKFFDTAL